MNIYVGNLAYDVSEEELQEAFSAFGQVTSAKIVKDRFTDNSKGFGFVEMPDKTEAETAVSSMNGQELKGRTLAVNEARPRTERRPSGGGGGGGGFGGGGGGGRSRY